MSKITKTKKVDKRQCDEMKMLENVERYFCRKSKESDDLRLSSIRACMTAFALYDGHIDEYHRVSEGIRNEKNFISVEVDLFITVCEFFKDRFLGGTK
ncbi:MAG: hypothetical protein GY862_11650 [Gammaproteobacteria bacterium]|nr:hypothetical protein [Gammaproteobacteria bacterium]